MEERIEDFLKRHGHLNDNELMRRFRSWLAAHRSLDVDAAAAYRTPPKLTIRNRTQEAVMGMHTWRFDDVQNIPKKLEDKHLLREHPLDSVYNGQEASSGLRRPHYSDCPAFAPLYFKFDGPSAHECRERGANAEHVDQLSEWQLLSMSADPASWTMVGVNEYAAASMQR